MDNIDCLELAENLEKPQTRPSTPVNTRLYYKFEVGEIVEVEHEPNKYWLATVIFSFDQLNLLRWIGNYGEFWVDTTSIEDVQEDNIGNNTAFIPTSMRLYPPGYHKQTQSKSEFVLQVPKTFLNRHFSFNSIEDTYNNEIKTLDDLKDLENEGNIKMDMDQKLVVCEEEETNKTDKKCSPMNYDDAKIVQINTTDETNETKETAIEKLNTKVVFGQEDEDELTLALENLIDMIEVKERQENCMKVEEEIMSIDPESNINKSSGDNEIINSNEILIGSKTSNDDDSSEKITSTIDNEDDIKQEIFTKQNNDYHTHLCSNIIEQAIEMGIYHNLEHKKVFSVKCPKNPINDYFDLNLLNDNQQMEIDYITNENIKIFFNHKCFTGPSLSKGKICSLPQYVGPGPSRLVIEEIVSKIISVAYVPPRILNDLSSKTFSDLLITRGLTDLTAIEFKAKYQKRIHREFIPVCLRSNDVALYCECICEHLKCCYNLFGPNLYDGDDCPGHCRALTKSNKFMKRATYYREKARLGEFMSNNNNNTSNNNNVTENVGKKQNSSNNNNNKVSRPRYAGRDSSESTSSSISRSEQVNSRASSSIGGAELNQLDNGSITPSDNIKENLHVVEEIIDENDLIMTDSNKTVKFDQLPIKRSASPEDDVSIENIPESQILENQQDKHIQSDDNQDVKDVIMEQVEVDETKLDLDNVQNEKPNEQEKNISSNILKQIKKPPIKWPNDAEFNMLDTHDLRPLEWTVADVAEHLDWCHLSSFKPYMISEGVDGQALLLLDRAAIKEHFLSQHPKLEYSPEEVGKLCRFVEFVKNHAELMA